MADFKHGQVVRIHRPGRTDHGKTGRYYGPGQVAEFAWVSFHKKCGELPDATQLHRQGDYPRKLYPLSQVQLYEPS